MSCAFFYELLLGKSHATYCHRQYFPSPPFFLLPHFFQNSSIFFFFLFLFVSLLLLPLPSSLVFSKTSLTLYDQQHTQKCCYVCDIFKFTIKSRRHRDFPYTPDPTHTQPFRLAKPCTQVVHLSQLSLQQHIMITQRMVHSWQCALCEFREMYNDIYQSSLYHRVFLLLKISSELHLSLCRYLATTDFITVSIVLLILGDFLSTS